MSVDEKALPAKICWLSIGKIWMIKSNCDKKWLLTAFLNWKMSLFFFLSTKCQNFQNKKLITKVRHSSVDTCIEKALQIFCDFLSQDNFTLVKKKKWDKKKNTFLAISQKYNF